jgi:hypothetical protein
LVLRVRFNSSCVGFVDRVITAKTPRTSGVVALQGCKSTRAEQKTLSLAPEEGKRPENEVKDLKMRRKT